MNGVQEPQMYEDVHIANLITSIEKKCTKCGLTKPLAKFNKEITHKEDHRPECKCCQKKIYRDKWYRKNRTRVKEYQRAYWGKNPEKYKEKYTRSNAIFKNSLEKRLFQAAKRRSKLQDIPFSINLGDISIPPICPVLGIPLQIGDGCCTDNSPSLDRIIPHLGYIPGNIVVISHKANTIKNSATVEELETITAFYKNLRRK